MRPKLTPEGSARVCEGKLQSQKRKADTKLEGSLASIAKWEKLTQNSRAHVTTSSPKHISTI